MITTFAKMLPVRQQLLVARWQFQKVREDFYRETRLDIAAKGLRNTETLFDRLETYEKRSRSRGKLEWRVFARIRETMQRGESFALAIKPFVPGDEYALLDIADESSREDAVVRGFELAEMAAKAKRVLSSTTSVQMAYPALLLISGSISSRSADGRADSLSRPSRTRTTATNVFRIRMASSLSGRKCSTASTASSSRKTRSCLWTLPSLS